jgi:hypothetical protein
MIRRRQKPVQVFPFPMISQGDPCVICGTTAPEDWPDWKNADQKPEHCVWCGQVHYAVTGQLGQTFVELVQHERAAIREIGEQEQRSRTALAAAGLAIRADEPITVAAVRRAGGVIFEERHRLSLAVDLAVANQVAETIKSGHPQILHGFAVVELPFFNQGEQIAGHEQALAGFERAARALGMEFPSA